MTPVQILGAGGGASGELVLTPGLAAQQIKPHLIHEVVTQELAARRGGNASTKTRADARGGGAKPWRQKGTGRARQGTRSAPQWKGGGVVFGPHPRGYELRMPAKMRRAALQGVLTGKAEDGALRVVEGFEMEEIGTKAFAERLAAWKTEGKVLVILPARDHVVERSCRNLPEVRVLLADSLNVVDLLAADTIVFTRDALARAQEVYA